MSERTPVAFQIRKYVT